MAQALLLAIDVNKVQDTFARCGEQMSADSVEAWLREMGFRRTELGWIAEEVSLMALDRSEYRILKRL